MIGKVVRFIPSLAAAPSRPATLPLALFENVDDVVSFNSLKSRIDLGSASDERHKQELHFAMRGCIEHPGRPNWLHDRDSRRITTSFPSTPLPE
jgi:hypothetical protein